MSQIIHVLINSCNNLIDSLFKNNINTSNCIMKKYVLKDFYTFHRISILSHVLIWHISPKDEKPTTTTMMVQNFWHGVAVLMWSHITSRHIGRWQWHRRLGSHNGLRNHKRASASCYCLKPKRILDFQFHTSHFANRCISNPRRGSKN